MEKWYPIGVNLIVGGFMTVVGFRVFIPKFRSERAKENFYKNFEMFFRLGGILMLLWGIFQLFRNLSI